MVFSSFPRAPLCGDPTFSRTLGSVLVMWILFTVVLAKEINLISLAQCSKTVLEEGDSRIIHL